jgi:hypothetical protein
MSPTGWKSRSITLCLTACFALTPSLSRASAGSEGAAFLNIPVGAGPAALGSAYSALATDAYAPVFNPGGLGFLSATELSGQHLVYLEDMHYEFASIVHPFSKKSGIAASIQYLGSGDITKTDPTGADVGDFSAHYAAYSLAYGRALTERLALGLTGKAIEAKLDDVSGHAFAGDIGFLYKAHPKATLAATLSNLGTDLKFLQDGDPLPMAFRVGTALRPFTRLTVSADVVHRKSGLTSLHMGFAWRPLEILSLRGGYRTDTLKGLDAMAGVSAGLGLHVWGQELAYAWVPYGDLGDTQYVSLTMRFGAAEDAKRNLIQYQSIRKHGTVKANEVTEPEYQQLMQLMSDSNDAIASRPGTEN